MIRDKLNELVLLAEALEKAGNGDEADRLLDPVLDKLRRIPQNHVIKLPPVSRFERDFTKEGYELATKEDGTPEDVEPSDEAEFEVVPVLDDGEAPISDKKMRERANDRKANRGQRDLEKTIKFLNSPEGEEDSKKLRGFYLLAPGTVWVGRGSRGRCVPIGRWGGSRWVVVLGYLASGCGPLGRFLASRKSNTQTLKS